jgi:hypothetical protein
MFWTQRIRIPIIIFGVRNPPFYLVDQNYFVFSHFYPPSSSIISSAFLFATLSFWFVLRQGASGSGFRGFAGFLFT